MTSPQPGPDDGRHLPEHRGRPGEQGPDGHESGQQQYGHPYGRAPRLAGSGGSGKLLRTTYTFVIVWLTCAVIMWFGTNAGTWAPLWSPSWCPWPGPSP
jgi:hypothetical protein